MFASRVHKSLRELLELGGDSVVAWHCGQLTNARDGRGRFQHVADQSADLGAGHLVNGGKDIGSLSVRALHQKLGGNVVALAITGCGGIDQGHLQQVLGTGNVIRGNVATSDFLHQIGHETNKLRRVSIVGGASEAEQTNVRVREGECRQRLNEISVLGNSL